VATTVGILDVDTAPANLALIWTATTFVRDAMKAYADKNL